MSVLRRCGLTLVEIARPFKLTHTSVVHGLRRVNADPELLTHVDAVMQQLAAPLPEPVKLRLVPEGDEPAVLQMLHERLRGELDQAARTRGLIDALCRQLGLQPGTGAPDGPQAQKQRPES